MSVEKIIGIQSGFILLSLQRISAIINPFIQKTSAPHGGFIFSSTSFASASLYTTREIWNIQSKLNLYRRFSSVGFCSLNVTHKRIITDPRNLRAPSLLIANTPPWCKQMCWVPRLGGILLARRISPIFTSRHHSLLTARLRRRLAMDSPNI